MPQACGLRAKTRRLFLLGSQPISEDVEIAVNPLRLLEQCLQNPTTQPPAQPSLFRFVCGVSCAERFFAPSRLPFLPAEKPCQENKKSRYINEYYIYWRRPSIAIRIGNVTDASEKTNANGSRNSIFDAMQSPAVPAQKKKTTNGNTHLMSANLFHAFFFRISKRYATRFSSLPIFSISTAIRSPAFNHTAGVRAKPTPDGVPVQMIAPGRRVIVLLSDSINAGMS